MANPGPVTVNTTNTQLVPTTQSYTSNPTLPVGANMFRLLGSARGVSLAATGDAATITINNAGVYSVSAVVVTNSQVSGASGSIATAAFGIFPAAGASGTAILANATRSSNTSAPVVVNTTSANTNALPTSVSTIFGAAVPLLYVNVGTALASATCDVFIYGYDLT